MLLFTSTLISQKLKFDSLSNCMNHLPIVAKWAEDEWGYIRNNGIEYREKVLSSISDDVYIGTFSGEPVAMFALLNHAFHKDIVQAANKLPHARELMYVYVDKEFRGLGFGKQIIEAAKQIAANSGADLILLDTLKPRLNRFYEKHGAEVVCEGQLFSCPTDVLRMEI